MLFTRLVQSIGRCENGHSLARAWEHNTVTFQRMRFSFRGTVLSVRGSRAVKPQRVRCSEVEVIKVEAQLVSIGFES